MCIPTQPKPPTWAAIRRFPERVSSGGGGRLFSLFFCKCLVLILIF